MSVDVGARTNSCYELEMKNKPVYRVISRLFDILFSLMFLVVILPIILIVAVVIKLEDGGPVFYSQTRLGQGGKTFTIYKIRSMRSDAEAASVGWTKAADDRITKVGRFIRKTRIDEVPQLYNILIGHMKLIGPRPERPELAEAFYVDLPEFVNRLAVKPGLTGLAQVNGGYDLTPAEKLVFDIEYINRRGFILDFVIICKTIGVVFSGEGAR